MADIFLSYSREDRAAIEPLAEQIAAAGYSVWWDKQLTGGKRYLEETEAELNAAKVVLVAWSKTSIASHWVADEAGAGRDTGRLLPISLDGSMPPLGFRQFQVIDFSKWTHDDGAALTQLTGALGKLTAPSGEARAAPLKRPAAKRLFERPLVLGGIALAALALVAVIAGATIALNPPKKPDTVDNQRAAFFGFAAADTNALTTQVAAAATEETYSTLNTLGVETAARGDTEGVALKDQLAKAGSLEARYALGGEVRTSGDRITVTIRLDDAQSRATLWQATLAGGSAQIESLPVQAAAKATYVVDCLTQTRPGMVREDAAALALVTRACEITNVLDPEGLTRWREAIVVAAKSPFAWKQTGARWIYQTAQAAPADRKAMMEETRKAYQKALEIDPNFAGALAGKETADLATDRPLAEILEALNAVLGARVDRSDRRSIGEAAAMRAALLSAMGRGAEAARLASTDVSADPLNVILQATYGAAFKVAGQPEQARRVFDLANRRFGYTLAWDRLASDVAEAGGDLGPIVAAAPPDVLPETIACWQDVARAVRASDANARKAGARRLLGCIRAGFVPAAHLPIVGTLGDVDAAFVSVTPLLNRSSPVQFAALGMALFSPAARPMRADPRFLPLVKQADIYQYWLDTGTQPDVCEAPEERDIEVCRELRKDQAK